MFIGGDLHDLQYLYDLPERNLYDLEDLYTGMGYDLHDAHFYR